MEGLALKAGTLCRSVRGLSPEDGVIGRPKTPIRKLPPLQIVPRPAQQRSARGERARERAWAEQQPDASAGGGAQGQGMRADVLLLGAGQRRRLQRVGGVLAVQ